MAHMDFYNCSDKDVRSTCNFDFDSIDYLIGGTWLQEGTAVFKEITILHEQIKMVILKIPKEIYFKISIINILMNKEQWSSVRNVNKRYYL